MAGAVGAAHALAHALRGSGKPLDIGVTATLEGIDVDLRGSGALDLAETRKLTATAQALDLARISNHSAIVVERRPPRIAFGEALVTLPPGGFLQATEAGEIWLAEFAEAALAESGRVADLFCGAGAFALRLARRREVFAADSDAAAIVALERAAASTPGLRRPSTQARDLFRRPLSARRARVLRRGPHRSAARRRLGPGARIRRERFAPRRFDLLQRGDFRPRRAPADRGRLPDRSGDAA